MQAPRLTHLTFDAVAVYSMMEMFLGYADQHLQGLVMNIALTQHKDGTQREGCYRATMSSAKEFVDESQTHHMLPLAKPGFIYDHRLNGLNGQTLVLNSEEIVLKGTRHGRILLRWSLNVETQTCGLGSLSGSRTEGSNSNLSLLEVREVLGE